MLDKLREIKNRFEETNELIALPEIIADQERWQALIKEHKELEEGASLYDRYMALQEQLPGLKEMLTDSSDDDMRDMVQMEINDIGSQMQELNVQIKELLSPKDPDDRKNVVLEIRAGTGGDEASLFGANLLRMYTRYSERRGYKMETLSSSVTELGGIKEIIVGISGKGVFSRLKFESGVHRVQRVPETESQGRIHTSAATVAVLPEAEDVEIEINANDLRIDVFRSGGHGGQSVNTTDSAVRITHLPTGLVVTCQDEKSQLKNKDKAMKVLKTRLLDLVKSEKDEEYANRRKQQVGSGDRSERIRTYNFPQGRVTDHRIGLTLYKLDSFMDGEMDEMIDALASAEK